MIDLRNWEIALYLSLGMIPGFVIGFFFGFYICVIKTG